MYILNENIRRHRKERGMTQRELAEQLGTTDKTVSRWESGVQIPDAETVPALARIFGVSIGELYGEEKPVAEAEPMIAKEAEKIAMEFPSANKRALRKTWIAAAVSVFLTLLGAAALCLNNVYSVTVVGYLPYPGTTAGRIFGLSTFFTGLVVMFVTLTVFRLWYRKPTRFNFIYADTDMNLCLTAIILYCILLLFVFPRFLSFPVNTPYIAVVYLVAFAVNFGLVLEKRRFRDYPVRTHTLVTVLSWVLGGLSLAALLVCMDLHVIELIEILSIDTPASADIPEMVLWVAMQPLLEKLSNSWFSGQYYYFLLTTSVPLTAMLLLNAIELKVCTRRLRADHPTEYKVEAKSKPLALRLIAGVVVFALMIGAVLGMLKLSGVLWHYESFTMLTDSMSPTLHSGDTVRVRTGVDVEHLERHNIILFDVGEGMQMLGRISCVNYNRDGQVVSYKVVQDNPNITDKHVVYPQNVIGVWLDAPQPVSSDEYEYGY